MATNSTATSRAAVVIGANGGIGQAVTAALRSMGYQLFLTYATAPPAAEADATGHWRQLDVCDSQAVRGLFAEAERQIGAPHALVYCAGIVRDAPLSLLSDQAWAQSMGVNLTGAFYAIRAVSRSMMVRKCGRIVLVGSVAARHANPGQGSYAASKAGLEALCRVAALELARYNITCNVVAPGPIESRMMRHVSEAMVSSTLQGIPLRRLGHPREVASAVCHLLGTDAGFTTGQAFQIDGGLSAH